MKFPSYFNEQQKSIMKTACELLINEIKIIKEEYSNNQKEYERSVYELFRSIETSLQIAYKTTTKKYTETEKEELRLINYFVLCYCMHKTNFFEEFENAETVKLPKIINDKELN